MSQSYEDILQGMLNKVPSNVDKREGSVIYDALAPCAFFLANQYFALENYLDLVFADTAVGEYLDRLIADNGMTRKPATFAVRAVSTNIAVSIDTLWGINGLVYKITEKTADNQYKAQCTTPGIIGNQYSGALTPISNITNVTATLGNVITPGADQETDDALRERFYKKVQMPATSGNAYQYSQWALEVPGVGGAKVFPLDNGPGTVSVIVVDGNKEISEALPGIVAEHIETVRPIGATVTVTNPTGKTIDVSALVKLDGSKTMENVTEAFEIALKSLLSATVFTAYSVSYAKIGSLLLDVPGVEDYSGLIVNGGSGNITIGSKEVPIKGSVALTEAV